MGFVFTFVQNFLNTTKNVLKTKTPLQNDSKCYFLLKNHFLFKVDYLRKCLSSFFEALSWYSHFFLKQKPQYIPK